MTTAPIATTPVATAPVATAPVATTPVTTTPVATTRPGTAPPVPGSSVTGGAYLPGAVAVDQSGGELPATPWQLPPAVADFVGREAELTRIRRALGDGTGRTGPAVAVLSGLPGIGKTALAVRAGWEVGPAHPDGCLYAQLVDDRGVAVDPYEVLGAFLCALGVPEGSVPVGRTERRDRYRSVVARRRILVLLDGAVDEAQVRPLLPTGPASAALVTARRPMAGLDGAHPVALDALPVEPAVRLLTGMLPERVASDLPAAHRLVELCDRLPSAIRVTGSRLAVRADPTGRWPRPSTGSPTARAGSTGSPTATGTYGEGWPGYTSGWRRTRRPCSGASAHFRWRSSPAGSPSRCWTPIGARPSRLSPT
ncbi:hypothetical protein ABGB07_22570 [Micromonosporaceae bacterium B7E4]